MNRFIWFLLVWTLGAVVSGAELKLAAPFSDHAILQRELPVPVWGTAGAGERVAVRYAGQSKETVADAQGRWRVVLDPLKAGAAGPLEVKASTTRVVQDVRAGEVWVCAGDAFMGRKVGAVRSARAALGSGQPPPVRWFKVKTTTAPEPRQELEGGWMLPEAGRNGEFPAVAYFFARELAAREGVPVGIVEMTDPAPVGVQRGGRVSGATVEAWMSEGALRALPAAKPIFDYYESPQALREALVEYEAALGDWKIKTGRAFGAELRELEKREPDVWYDYVAEMRKAGKPAPSDPPRKPTVDSLRLGASRAGNLYNGMVAPLAGLAVRGVALHLGLGNAPRASQCATLFPALLEDWRKAWGRADLPFVFLQPGRSTASSLDPRALSELRAAIAEAAQPGRAAMVRTLDLAGDLFPEDVPELGRRMASAAEGLLRGGRGEGPVIEGVVFEGDRAVVSLRGGAASLVVRGGGALQGFALTERPNRWAYAEAWIEGDKVVVRHSKLKVPVALRYDWVVEPGFEGNLTDASGLPALPFRSDVWPAFTDTLLALRPNATAPLQPADLFPVVDPALPRVLLIGDSIMNGYAPFVVQALKGKANVQRMIAFGMIGGNDTSAAAFCAKLKEGEYALIHYNDGLHSLPPRITDAQFEVGLTAMLKHLKTVTPHVIWATTTPAPDRENTLGPQSANPTVFARNALSRSISAEAGVTVNDLYECVIGERESLQGFADLHFKPEGSLRMAEQIVHFVLQALEKKQP